MKKFARIAAALAILLGAISCSKEKQEAEYASQESKIESFVQKMLTEKPERRVVYTGKSVRIVLKEGDGEELRANARVVLRYAGYDFSSGNVSAGVMFATNDESTAISSSWNITDNDLLKPLELNLEDKNVLDGLKDGLVGVKSGEECYILFTGKYGYKKAIGTIPANAPLAYHVWVDEIKNTY